MGVMAVSVPMLMRVVMVMIVGMAVAVAVSMFVGMGFAVGVRVLMGVTVLVFVAVIPAAESGFDVRLGLLVFGFFLWSTSAMIAHG